MTDAAPSRPQGWSLVRFSWQSTAVLVALLAVGVASPSGAGPAVGATSVVMFVAGVSLMAYTYAVGIRRSRHEFVSVPGLFLLQGSAPAAVRRHMLWSFAIQTILAIIAASIRLYSLVAFGILAPTLGLGLCGLWAARYGTFEQRKRGGS